jgi:hypothetical protein
MPAADETLWTALRRHAQSLPGFEPSPNNPEQYHILDGFLDQYVEFEQDQDRLLLRMTEATRTGVPWGHLVEISRDMLWDTLSQGWQWVNVRVDGSVSVVILVACIDESHELTRRGLSEENRVVFEKLASGRSLDELERELALEKGFEARWEELRGLARPATLLKSRPAEEGDLVPGQSRLGGAPDLPADFPWPEHEGRPMGFLAQINLADCPAPFAGLRQGLLHVFSACGRIDPEEGFPELPEEVAGPEFHHLSLFTGDVSTLAPRSAPDGIEAYSPALLEAKVIRTYPSGDDPAVTALLTDPEARFTYQDYSFLMAHLVRAMTGVRERTLLGGYPDLIQGELGPVPLREPALLLQVASDSNADMLWGDAGSLYFLAERADLEAAEPDLSRVYLDFQCC